LGLSAGTGGILNLNGGNVVGGVNINADAGGTVRLGVGGNPTVTLTNAQLNLPQTAVTGTFSATTSITAPSYRFTNTGATISMLGDQMKIRPVAAVSTNPCGIDIESTGTTNIFSAGGGSVQTFCAQGFQTPCSRLNQTTNESSIGILNDFGTKFKVTYSQMEMKFGSHFQRAITSSAISGTDVIYTFTDTNNALNGVTRVVNGVFNTVIQSGGVTGHNFSGPTKACTFSSGNLGRIRNDFGATGIATGGSMQIPQDQDGGLTRFAADIGGVNVRGVNFFVLPAAASFPRAEISTGTISLLSSSTTGTYLNNNSLAFENTPFILPRANNGDVNLLGNGTGSVRMWANAGPDNALTNRIERSNFSRTENVIGYVSEKGPRVITNGTTGTSFFSNTTGTRTLTNGVPNFTNLFESYTSRLIFGYSGTLPGVNTTHLAPSFTALGGTTGAFSDYSFTAPRPVTATGTTVSIPYTLPGIQQIGATIATLHTVQTITNAGLTVGTNNLTLSSPVAVSAGTFFPSAAFGITIPVTTVASASGTTITLNVPVQPFGQALNGTVISNATVRIGTTNYAGCTLTAGSADIARSTGVSGISSGQTVRTASENVQIFVVNTSTGITIAANATPSSSIPLVGGSITSFPPGSSLAVSNATVQLATFNRNIPHCRITAGSTTLTTNQNESVSASTPLVSTTFTLDIQEGITVSAVTPNTSVTLSGNVIPYDYAANGTMITNATVTIGGTAYTECVLTGGSPTIFMNVTPASTGGAVAPLTYRVTIPAATTLTNGANPTTFTLNNAPTCIPASPALSVEFPTVTSGTLTVYDSATADTVINNGITTTGITATTGAFTSGITTTGITATTGAFTSGITTTDITTSGITGGAGALNIGSVNGQNLNINAGIAGVISLRGGTGPGNGIILRSEDANVLAINRQGIQIRSKNATVDPPSSDSIATSIRIYAPVQTNNPIPPYFEQYVTSQTGGGLENNTYQLIGYINDGTVGSGTIQYGINVKPQTTGHAIAYTNPGSIDSTRISTGAQMYNRNYATYVEGNGAFVNNGPYTLSVQPFTTVLTGGSSVTSITLSQPVIGYNVSSPSTLSSVTLVINDSNFTGATLTAGSPVVNFSSPVTIAAGATGTARNYSVVLAGLTTTIADGTITSFTASGNPTGVNLGSGAIITGVTVHPISGPRINNCTITVGNPSISCTSQAVSGIGTSTIRSGLQTHAYIPNKAIYGNLNSTDVCETTTFTPTLSLTSGSLSDMTLIQKYNLIIPTDNRSVLTETNIDNTTYTFTIQGSTTISSATANNVTQFTLSNAITGTSLQSTSMISNVTLTINGVIVTGCTLTNNSTIVYVRNPVNITQGHTVTAKTFSVTIPPSTTMSSTGGSARPLAVLNNAPTSADDSALYAVVLNVALKTSTMFGTIIVGSKTVIFNDTIPRSTEYNTNETQQTFLVGGADQFAPISISSASSGIATLSGNIVGTSGVSMISGFGNESSLQASYHPYIRVTVGSTQISVPPGLTLNTAKQLRSPSLLVSCQSLTPSSNVLLAYISGAVPPTNNLAQSVIIRRPKLTTDIYFFNAQLISYFAIIGATHDSYYSYNVVN
jgi:hypothetical protein